MAVSARSTTNRIVRAVQGVLDAATRLIEEIAPTPRPQLVPVRVRSREQR